jgi:hypothetical protein
MPTAILYNDVKEKNVIEAKLSKPLSPVESLIHCLNVIDFIAALRNSAVEKNIEEEIEWIILPFKTND